MVGDLIADVDPELGYDREIVMMEAADIGGQGQQAARSSYDRAVR